MQIEVSEIKSLTLTVEEGCAGGSYSTPFYFITEANKDHPDSFIGFELDTEYNSVKLTKVVFDGFYFPHLIKEEDVIKEVGVDVFKAHKARALAVAALWENAEHLERIKEEKEMEKYPIEELD